MADELHVHIHLPVPQGNYGSMKPPQAGGVGRDEMYTESDQDREYRLMLKYTSHDETLTPEEFEFLKRRGCVRY